MVDYDNIDFENLKKQEGIRIIKSLIDENKELKIKVEKLSSKQTPYSLSKNLIKVLVFIANTISKSDNMFFDVNDIYGTNNRGSNTAFLTQLKYLGAIIPYFTQDDAEKKSKRSGKWIITREGYLFLNRKGKLPLKVIVQNKKVISQENYCMIDDASIKWKTEDDIWTDLNDYYDMGEYNER